jgi:hypothetical protein
MCDRNILSHIQKNSIAEKCFSGGKTPGAVVKWRKGGERMDALDQRMADYLAFLQQVEAMEELAMKKVYELRDLLRSKYPGKM